MKVLTLEQAARLLRLHPSTVYRMVKRGEIPAVKIGRVWRFTMDALQDWLNGRAGGEAKVGRQRRRVRKGDDPVLRVAGILAIGTLSKDIEAALYGRATG